MTTYYYDYKRFNFANKFKRAWNIYANDDLYDLSFIYAPHLELIKRETDQKTEYHKFYYEWARTEEFTTMYQEFLQKYVKPIYNEPIVYQTIPTFRIAFHENIAVGEFHKDKHYRNGEWALKVKEDNFYLPFTDAWGTNTIWVESEEDKGDFKAMGCPYGGFVKWDGSNLTHGNKINSTGRTRVSVDFRVIKYSNYVPSEAGSINMNSKFELGGYYSLMK